MTHSPWYRKYGDLMDAETAETIRPATRSELARSNYYRDRTGEPFFWLRGRKVWVIHV